MMKKDKNVHLDTRKSKNKIYNYVLSFFHESYKDIERNRSLIQEENVSDRGRKSVVTKIKMEARNEGDTKKEQL